MKFEKIEIKACCGKKQIMLILSQPIEDKHIQALISNDFKQIASYAKNGILYMENAYCTITCPIGSNRLQVKLRNKDNEEDLKKIEDIVLSI